MAKKGFIKIPKRLFDTKWWNEKRVFSKSEAFLDIYILADDRNTCRVSVRSLAGRWIWGQTKVFRFLLKLEKEGYLSVEKSTSGMTLKIPDIVANATQPATPSATPTATQKSANTEGLSDVGTTPSATPTATQPATPKEEKKRKETFPPTPPYKENKIKEEKENSSITTAVKETEFLAEVRLFFNKTVENCLIPKVRSITGERRSMLLARIREYSLEEVYEAFTKAASSNFLNGGGNRGFVADFTWIVRPNNFPKVLEGTYDNRTAQSGTSVGVVLQRQDYSKTHF